jgi:hypothetical protein
MKTLAVDSSIRGEPALAESVFRASNILDHELGRSADLVKAEWRLARDEQGRNRIVLRISEWTASAEGFFTPEDLESPDVTRGRILGLWGRSPPGPLPQAGIAGFGPGPGRHERLGRSPQCGFRLQ